MMLAYIFNNYDVEHVQTRPPNTWIASSVVPPMKATVRIKRKKVSGLKG
jgi:hypothetical protein